MKLFVESWESVLCHSDGSPSNGYKAFRTKDGEMVPYSQERILYIHHLEVGSVRNEDLKSYVDSKTHVCLKVEDRLRVQTGG